MNSAGCDDPPPGLGVSTVRTKVPALAVCCGMSRAASSVALTQRVSTTWPSSRTTELGLKSRPTIRKLADVASTAIGGQTASPNKPGGEGGFHRAPPRVFGKHKSPFVDGL